jgi:hypothetical protein
MIDQGAATQAQPCSSAGHRRVSPAKGYVARGGIEPPTFRFSVARKSSGCVASGPG